MKAVCRTCMHTCNLESGQRGICGVRKNEDGRIVSENYGCVTSLALDPIEKKPLKMFYPGSMILSVGSFGCNLKCPFCQNHEISMMCLAQAKDSLQYRMRDIVNISPQELAQKALDCQKSGNIGVAFTYNEPLVGWEYVCDTAKLVRAYGMKNVLVTNGTASMEVLEEILPFIDAMNIDLKGFQEEYYHKLGGSLEAVQEFIIRAAQACHVELTTLIVPGENDTVSEIKAEALWIAREVGQHIPLHITRFFPRYQMQDRNATDVQLVYRLANLAGKYLEHVFVGNC